MANNVLTQSKIFTNAVANTTTPYVAGDLVGGKNTIGSDAQPVGSSSKPSGVINAVYIHCTNDVNVVDLEVVFFEADPAGSAFSDADEFDVASVDLVTIVGVAQLSTEISFADNRTIFAHNLGIPFQLRPGFRGLRRLYAAVVARTAITLTGNNALTLRTHILLD